MNRALVAATALTFALSASAARAQSGPQSTAAALHANLQSQGIGSVLGPVAALDGPPTGKYDRSITLPAVQRNAAIFPKNPTPTLFSNATGVTSHVSGSGIAVDSRSSEGDNALATVNLMLSLNPPPPTANPTPFPPLLINAKEVISSANFSIQYGIGSFASGATSFGSLTITGTLLGGKVLKYSGQVPPNTLAFDSPAVTVTLNRQVKYGVITCNPACGFTPTSIEVTAIDVALHNADDYGTKVSGDIQVNHDTAS